MLSSDCHEIARLVSGDDVGSLNVAQQSRNVGVCIADDGGDRQTRAASILEGAHDGFAMLP